MIDAETKRVRETVRREAKRIGATIVEDNNGKVYAVKVEAPAGHQWAEGIHELVAYTNVGPWSYAEVWDDLLSRMADGTERCDTDCEWWEGR